jgi:hypothetical protein
VSNARKPVTSLASPKFFLRAEYFDLLGREIFKLTCAVLRSSRWRFALAAAPDPRSLLTLEEKRKVSGVPNREKASEAIGMRYVSIPTSALFGLSDRESAYFLKLVGGT